LFELIDPTKLLPYVFVPELVADEVVLTFLINDFVVDRLLSIYIELRKKFNSN
jgi:hypothetical protein